MALPATRVHQRGRCTDEVRSGDGAAGAVARNDGGDSGVLLTAAATQSKCYGMRHKNSTTHSLLFLTYCKSFISATYCKSITKAVARYGVSVSIKGAGH